jgi:hypothetical protein
MINANGRKGSSDPPAWHLTGSLRNDTHILKRSVLTKFSSLQLSFFVFGHWRIVDCRAITTYRDSPK